jgi:pilus assembly protein CpaB
MKPKTMLLLLVAVGCGLTAAYLTAIGVGTGPRANEMRYVAVAKEPIKANTKINTPEDLFILKPFPKDSVSDKAIDKLDDLRGKVTSREIKPLRSLDPDEDFGAHLKILNDLPPGYRAVSVTTNIATAAAGFILPGNRVDMLCTVNDASDARRTTTKMFLQDVLVLAVNNLQDKPEEKGAISAPATVTIAVTPKDAERVVWTTQRSTVYFVLRKNGETQGLVKTPGAHDAFDQGSPEANPVPTGPDPTAMVKIPVAKKPVPANTKIDENTFGDWFEELDFPKAFADKAVLKNNLQGQTIYVGVLAGNYPTRANLLDSGPAPEKREVIRVTFWNGPNPETVMYDKKTGLRIDDTGVPGPGDKPKDAPAPGAAEGK